MTSQWSCRDPAPASRSRPRASSPTCSASRAPSSPSMSPSRWIERVRVAQLYDAPCAAAPQGWAMRT
eukprot:scaffold132142_cov63-Phaeocystis_antarctica.AAC.1